jgi:hypothetical protein
MTIKIGATVPFYGRGNVMKVTKTIKGPAPIPIPDIFTLEWYIQQKESEITDRDIADSLYISYGTLHNWKQRIGWISGNGSKYCGRKSFIDKQRMMELYADGLNYYEIAEVLECSRETIAKYIQKMRLGGLENGSNITRSHSIIG